MQRSGCRGSSYRPGLLRTTPGLVLLAAIAVGCSDGPGGSSEEPLPTSSTPSVAREDLADSDLWLSFDETKPGYDGAPEYPDALGRPFVGRMHVANGGAVEMVEGDGGEGQAVAFPANCRSETGCPRALVEVRSGPALDPADADFAYGASVWLEPDQTTTGSNILQKGRFGSSGGQWKLQVDSLEGQPSCVVRSGKVKLSIRSSVSVSDSSWHRIVCARAADGISIDVDGTVAHRKGATGSVTNQWPLRIGSPGVGDHDDQFHGRIDDVFLRIGP
jgi:hypothetical protein